MVSTLDPSASNMEEHIKLIDGISDPSDIYSEVKCST